MRFTEEAFEVVCGCRSAGECTHNAFAWKKALETMVDAFAAEMKTKLLQAAIHKGRSGWDNPDWTVEQIEQRLREHVEKGDMRDVANLAMFRWNRY
jgi:hypothetical protein